MCFVIFWGAMQKCAFALLIPNMRGERPPTQIIMAKLIKANNQLKQAVLFVYIGCLSLKQGLRVQVEDKVVIV